MVLSKRYLFVSHFRGLLSASSISVLVMFVPEVLRMLHIRGFDRLKGLVSGVDVEVDVRPD